MTTKMIAKNEGKAPTHIHHNDGSTTTRNVDGSYDIEDRHVENARINHGLVEKTDTQVSSTRTRTA
jgi:hypothetical protein